MPQLMPLMWCYSILMSLLIIFMLVEMFYYKFEFNFVKKYFSKKLNNLNYKW